MQAHCDLMSLSENVLYYMALLNIASGPASPCQGIKRNNDQLPVLT